MTSRRARILVMLAIAFAGFGTKSTAASDAASEVLAFEKEMEAAVVRGDVKFLDRICASDFSFTHGDAWTTGGPPLRVENRVLPLFSCRDYWLRVSRAPDMR